MDWMCSAVTHTGHKRSLNEDAYFVNPKLGLWAVADGMGGHHGGKEASQMIVQKLKALKHTSTNLAMQQQLHDCLDQVNYALYHKSLTEPPYDTIGSTLALMLTQKNHCQLFWAGDSRIYLLREKKLMQLSHDHSYVQKLTDRGELSPADAKHHPKANLITNAVGIQAIIKLETHTLQAKPGDRFLICSDGLYNELSEQEITHFLKKPSLESGCEDMLKAVLKKEASDNITIVMLAFDETGFYRYG
jgi:protein phosphatase